MIELALYRIEDELESLANSAQTCPDELREEFEERIAQYLEAEVGKIDNIGWLLSQLESVQAHARTEMERLHIRQQNAEKAEQSLKAYVLRVLARRNGKPLKGKNITLFARRTEALIIDDPEAVPAEWKRTQVTVDIPREPLKRAIKEGQNIPGVHIEPREHLGRR